MGVPVRSTSCPGCAEEIPVGNSACPLCETPVGSGGSGVGLQCGHCGASAPLDASTCPKCGKGLAVGGGVWMVFPVLLVFLVVVMGVFAAIALPNFKKAKERASQRACFANQKVLAGAMEMYNLDNNAQLKELDPEIMRRLVEHGYLMKIPECPSAKQGGRAYSLNDEGDPKCSVHGTVMESMGRRKR